MGSWNATCSISHLPIRSGDPVYVLPIIGKYNTASSMCYGEYSPFGFLMEGEYDDYGSADNITSDWKVEYLQHILKEIYLPPKDTSSLFEDEYFKFETKIPDIDTILRVIERGKCFSISNIPIGLWIAHKDIVDYIIEYPITIYNSEKHDFIQVDIEKIFKESLTILLNEDDESLTEEEKVIRKFERYI